MKKAFRITVISLIVLVGFAAAIPVVFKDDIIVIVKEEANKNLKANVDFGDFSLSLFTNFPDFTFSIENVVVNGIDQFEGVQLAKIGELSFTLDVVSVFKGESIKIQQIYLANTAANVMVLENGMANYDIAMPADTAIVEPVEVETADTGEATDFKIALKSYVLENINLIYNDATMPMAVEVIGLNHSGSGDFTKDLFNLNTTTSIDKVTFNMDGVAYMSHAAINIDADLEMDMANAKYTFKENRIAINQLLLGVNGWVAMPSDGMDMDVSFFAQETKLRGLMSMVPAVFTEGFEALKISGDFALDGFVKGVMSDKLMPGFGINMNIKEGRIAYPDLPKSIDNINVKAKVVSLGGESLDNTIIDLPVVHLEVAENQIDMKLNITNPITDPLIKFGLKAEVMLAELRDAMPFENGEELSGFIKSDVILNGRLSAIETENYEAFTANGVIDIRDMLYKASDMPTASIKHADFRFSPKELNLADFQCVYGKTDVSANGVIGNYLAYALKDETLKGTFNVSSNKIDLNEFMQAEEKTEANVEVATNESIDANTDEAPLSVIEIPENIDFTLQATIKQLLYDNVEISNTNGQILIKNGVAKLNQLRMETLGGKVIMDGTYNTTDVKVPKIDFAFGIEGLDINKTAKTFNTVEKMAPIAKNCQGRFNANFTLAGDLNGQMEPLMESLYGNGGLSTKEVAVDGFKPLTKLADVLKNPSLAKPTLKNINITFKFVDGRVFVDPFDVNFQDINATMFGSNGFDQTIDYTMNLMIPRDKLGGEANKLVDGLMGQANSMGANFSLGETVNVDVLVSNTISDPKIKTAIGKSGGKSAKTVLKETFNEKKKEIEEKVKAELDKAKKQAQEAIEQKKAEAKKKIEEEKKRLEAEAKKKIEAEKKRLKAEAKKKAEEEAKKKLKGLFNK
jgi:hypothetical protein